MRFRNLLALGACALLVACADNARRDLPVAAVETAPKLGAADEPATPEKTVVDRPVVVEAPAPVGRPLPE
jgi:hypothetical protein